MQSPDSRAEIAASIERTAREGVERFQFDGMSGSALPIEQQIAADRYLAARRAGKSPLAGVRLTQIVPGPSL